MPGEKNNLIAKSPVVVVLGHVDHGKTAILDFIRKTKVAERESGGITQHIGAYEVEHQGKKITFIDTPGHEAFSAMRQRGAHVADVAVLVIAATEGVKEQTKEAIKFVQREHIPVIVALNKIDRPEAQPEKVKRDLAKCDILVESMGGRVPSIKTSAKTGQGLQELLELILLVAEMEELRADISTKAQGMVIESYLDSKKGPVATLILQNGILKRGDIVATSSAAGKIKGLENFQGKPIETALPSQPVSVLGLDSVAVIGDKFKAFPTLEEAYRAVKKDRRKEKPSQVLSIEPDKKVLNVILKTDVLGSQEAIEETLKALPQEKVILRLLKSGVGDILISDVRLAESARAKIFGFRVKVDAQAKAFCQQKKIKPRIFEVIYELIQAVREAMTETLAPKLLRQDVGKFKVTVIFKTEKSRQIVGGKVLEGEIKKGDLLEVERREEKIGRGKALNLQENKKDVARSEKGRECGILFEGNVKIEQGDILLIYREERQKDEL